MIITGDGLTIYSLLVIKSRYNLELKGLKGRGQTMYSLVKQRFGFKGSRQSVYNQFCSYIREQAEKTAPAFRSPGPPVPRSS
jgi:hypothetical protein